jgi:hypothetical protein
MRSKLARAGRIGGRWKQGVTISAVLSFPCTVAFASRLRGEMIMVEEEGGTAAQADEVGICNLTQAPGKPKRLRVRPPPMFDYNSPAVRVELGQNEGYQIMGTTSPLVCH